MNETYQIPSHFKIISGGQTGADRAGLDWAIVHHIEHKGWCPQGRKSEDGLIPKKYRLQETASSGYSDRSKLNVLNSDATVIFTMTENLKGDSRRSVYFAEKFGYPHLHLWPEVHPKYLASFLDQHKVVTLNVTGQRDSDAPGISQFVVSILDAAISINANTKLHVARENRLHLCVDQHDYEVDISIFIAFWIVWQSGMSDPDVENITSMSAALPIHETLIEGRPIEIQTLESLVRVMSSELFDFKWVLGDDKNFFIVNEKFIHLKDGMATLTTSAIAYWHEMSIRERRNHLSCYHLTVFHIFCAHGLSQD